MMTFLSFLLSLQNLLITKYSILACWHDFPSAIAQQSITVYQPEVTRVAM